MIWRRLRPSPQFCSSLRQVRLEVINVGDGACSAVSCDYHPDEVTLIDCGTHNRSDVLTGPEVAASQHLGGRLANLTTMVVTHFDADHWGGLRDLAEPYRRRQSVTTRKLALYYPGMPVGWATSAGRRDGELMAGLMALTRFVSPTKDDPVDLIALKNAWRGTADVRHRPLYRGDTFAAHGHDWVVHWPPRRVNADRGRLYEAWLTEIEELANAMADDEEHPDPTLRDQLHEAYAQWSGFCAEDDERRGLGHEQSDEVDGISDRHLPTVDPIDNGDQLGVSDGERVTYQPNAPGPSHELAHIGAKYRGKVRELTKAMKGIDNYLSLVVSVSDDFITFGDIEGSALGELLHLSATSRPRLEASYRIMLAPHHGSHDGHAHRLPKTDVCVSQNGSWLQPFNAKHTGRHACNGKGTWEHGTLVFNDLWCCSCPSWRRRACEALRRLVAPLCGSSRALHNAIAALSDEALLHLLSCAALRDVWATLWTPCDQEATNLYEAVLAASHDEFDSLTPSQIISLVKWFSSDRAVTRLAAGARLIADGGTPEEADFMFCLGGQPADGQQH